MKIAIVSSAQLAKQRTWVIPLWKAEMEYEQHLRVLERTRKAHDAAVRKEEELRAELELRRKEQRGVTR